MTQRFLDKGFRGLVWLGMTLALSAGPGYSAVIDPAFSTSANGAVSAIALQPDGKILVGGMFTEIGGAPRSYLARLNSDGVVDASFQPTNGPSQPVYGIVVSDGKIFVGAGDGLRRLNGAGAVEWKYSMAAKTFAVDSRQRVVFGGQFSRIDGLNHRNLARLTVDGLLDSTFVLRLAAARKTAPSRSCRAVMACWWAGCFKL